MMTKLSFDYERRLLEEQVRYKRVPLGAISYLGDNMYNVDNMELEFSPNAEISIDKLIGITPSQKKTVSIASGNSGLSILRNYMNIATNIGKERNVVLVADIKNQKINDVVPLVEDFISYDSFFNLAEMIIDKGRFNIFNIETSGQGTGVTLYLHSLDPTIKKISKDEEFDIGGAYLHWDVSSVEAGNYFTRLACTNGAVERIENKKSIQYSLSTENMSSLLNIAQNGQIQSDTFDKYSHKALLSMNTQASLREAVKCTELLTECGIPEELCERLFSSNEEQELCLRKGYEKKDYNKVISRHNVWGLYNSLTQIATHDSVYLQNDGRRKFILDEAGHLLYKKHDIKNYFNLYH